MITVCNVADLSFQFAMSDGRSLVVCGKNKAVSGINGLILPYGQTKMEIKDWEEIKKKYAHMYEIKRGLIFAEKNDAENFAKATDSETQAKPTGTAKIKTKDLGAGVTATADPRTLVE